MLRDYVQRLMRFLTGRKPPPHDPWSLVRQPLRRGPPSLNAAIALEEPAPQRSLNLFGAMFRK